MSWRKEPYKDAATHAFVCYAYHGCPTREELENRIRGEALKKYSMMEPEKAALYADRAVAKQTGLLRDIDAVNAVLETLEEKGKGHIADAIRAVYFVNPHGKLRVNAIKSRARRFAIDYPASERSVYYWLKSARRLFAIYNDLNIYDFGPLV